MLKHKRTARCEVEMQWLSKSDQPTAEQHDGQTGHHERRSGSVEDGQCGEGPVQSQYVLQHCLRCIPSRQCAIVHRIITSIPALPVVARAPHAFATYLKP